MGKKTAKRSAALAGHWVVCKSWHYCKEPYQPKFFEAQSAAERWNERRIDRGGRLSKRSSVDDTIVLPVVGLEIAREPSLKFREYYQTEKIPLRFEISQPANILKDCLRGTEPRVRCYLADEWKFDEIERDVRKRLGHRYDAQQHDTYPQMFVKAIYDFDDALLAVHGPLSPGSVADFFTSWQMFEHLTTICEEIESSNTAKNARALRLRNWDNIGAPKDRLLEVFFAYAHEIRSREKASAATAPQELGALQPETLPDSASDLNREAVPFHKQLDAWLKTKSLKHETVAEFVEVDIRTFYRHKAGLSVPRAVTMRRYDDLFSGKLT